MIGPRINLGTHGVLDLWFGGPTPTHSYRVERDLGFGNCVLVHLARGKSGRQKFWWPAVLQWRENRRGTYWQLAGQVNPGGPANGAWQKVHANKLVGSHASLYNLSGHAPDTETGVRIMLAILEEFNS
jgi:hypothetical protein